MQSTLEMTKVAIIGAGNMGGAIASALYRQATDTEVSISNPSTAKLNRLKDECPTLSVHTDNVKAIDEADIIILAVKPWILPEVVVQIAPVIEFRCQKIVSLAGGVDITAVKEMFVKTSTGQKAVEMKIYRAIPNTAISVGQGMTFVCSDKHGESDVAQIRDLFANMGKAAVIPESLIDAATALSSCGIAYVFKGIQAAVQAGVQLGFRPSEALGYVNATIAGAVALMEAEGLTPQEEIDKVTTPGGMTIKGINSLEHDAFPSAIINAILSPLAK